MTNKEAIDVLRGVKLFFGRDCIPNETPQAIDMAIAALEKQEGKKPIAVETNIYDQEEIHHNCTVQVLTNSVTGEVSVGWWEEKEDGRWKD